MAHARKRQSIVMVLFAKWILENNPKPKVVITDAMSWTNKKTCVRRCWRNSPYSAAKTYEAIGQAKPRLLCSLVHKFGKKDVDNFDDFIEELKSSPSKTVGELFVFVDECHRTQSGKLHKVMKALLPNAVFIGFTGTPLLKKDKQTSLEVFGKYIHTYKFNEAVEDEVVLDLMYEARNIEQRIISQERIDAWFESRTKGLNDFQKSELKRKWGTIRVEQQNRMQQIVNDVVLISTKPRLSNDRCNAILVAGSILEAVNITSCFRVQSSGQMRHCNLS